MRAHVRLAKPDDLGALVVLFEGYRSFYEQMSDPQGAEAFLRDRLARRDSVLLVAAEPESAPVGFVQLYPCFSSTAMRRIFILNDLFVAPEARRMGVARALMRAAEEHARAEGAARLSLSTAIKNESAQRLYEAQGYERDRSFYQYHLPL